MVSALDNDSLDPSVVDASAYYEADIALYDVPPKGRYENYFFIPFEIYDINTEETEGDDLILMDGPALEQTISEEDLDIIKEFFNQDNLHEGETTVNVRNNIIIIGAFGEFDVDVEDMTWFQENGEDYGYDRLLFAITGGRALHIPWSKLQFTY